jgi:Holliday junction resolvasome RuvABC endonuclease subunit
VILGVDTGLATCGWALLDERACSFVDLGVVTQKAVKGRTITLDRIQRANALAQVLGSHVRGVSIVVVESLSLGMPGAIAKLSVGLSWGTLLGIVAMLDPKPRLLTIAPQRWQREVLPNAGKSVDYDELARAAAEHLLARHPAAARALRRIPESKRNHAIDAAMIALCGALRPQRCEDVGEPDRQRAGRTAKRSAG